MIGEGSQLANDFWILLAMVIYFAAMLSIGFIYSKRSNSSSKEYFAGGRGVGPWLTALSAEASDMSGWLLMGLPGVAYFTGAADPMWTAIGLALGTYLNWKLVARRLRRYSVVAGDAITIPDFFSKRFHDKKNIVSTIAAVIILLFFTIYTASCFVTVGKLFATLFGWDYHLTMVIGAAIVFAYTIIGGYLSVVVTDFIQGLLMFFALAVVFIGSVASAGGIDNTVAFLKGIPGFLDGTHVATPILNDAGEQIVKAGQAMFGAPADYGIITIISMLAWGLGYFGMPHILVRFMAVRDEREMTKSKVTAISWVALSLGFAVFIGILGRAYLPELVNGNNEKVFIEMIKKVFTMEMRAPFIAGLFLCGILAAIMSTADSQLLVSASSVAEDIFKGLLKKDADDKTVMNVSRVTVLVVAVLAYIIAWNPNNTVMGLVSNAWAGLGAAFGPLVVMSLYWKRTNFPGAVAGIVTGALAVIIWDYIPLMGGQTLGKATGLYSLVVGFGLGLIAIIAVSLATKAPSEEMLQEFEDVKENRL